MRSDLTRLRRVAVALACVAAVSGPALGQGAAPSPRDLEALNYYVGSNDTTAAEAELRRLRAQFPGWQPPADLSRLRQTQPTAEIDRIYREIASGNLTGARKTITDTQAAFPSWTPPDEMTRLLETSEAQAAFDNAVRSGNSQQAVEIARRSPQLLRCDRVNNAWQLAEMQQSVQDTTAAVQTYRGIINSCPGLPEVTATLQKADAVASAAQMADLFAVARGRFAGSAAELVVLETRLQAGRGQTPTATAPAAAPARTATAPRPAEPQAAPAPRAPAAQAPARVATTPLRGVAPSGRSLPARGDGRLRQVQAAAAAGANAQCIALSNGARSLDVLYERSWCAYNLDRPLEALAGFRAAERGGLGAEVQRDARFGMTLSFLAQNMTEEAARVAAATDLTQQQRIEVETIILDQRGTRAYEMKQYSRAIAFFDAYEQLTGTLRRDLAILRAYAYLNDGDRVTARQQFQLLNDQLATSETRNGLRAASR
ncbi:hypothetical protein LX76_02119 [Cereibacter changlensis]|uniref:Tetratricopeptide repeat protein n=3 Tax=Cereibacter changlensis TaxID=402884 RepID=A0A2W7SUQ3_9RHOB|nr:hypothetical protein [Cereibacter changlensis]PZX54472.1 hypothetical protein LX76_02119 [Cereibacter changlensis]